MQESQRGDEWIKWGLSGEQLYRSDQRRGAIKSHRYIYQLVAKELKREDDMILYDASYYICMPTQDD